MTKQAKIRSTTNEQMLINIVRTLPPERASQLIDFARFLQSLAIKSCKPAVLEEEKSSGDEKWEQLLAKPEAQQAMIEMAHKARADHAAGRTTEIAVTEDGRLAPA